VNPAPKPTRERKKRRTSKPPRNADKSALFLDYWRLLCPEGSVPVQEYRFAPPRRFRFDHAFLAHHVAVEVDGGVYLPHGGRHGTDKDREKLNIAAALGWRVLRFSPAMLNRDPAGCVELVKCAMGWTKEGRL